MHLSFLQALFLDACAFSLVATESGKDSSLNLAWEATQIWLRNQICILYRRKSMTNLLNSSSHCNLKTGFMNSSWILVCITSLLQFLRLKDREYSDLHKLVTSLVGWCGGTEWHRVPRQVQRRATLLQKPGLFKQLVHYQLHSFKT